MFERIVIPLDGSAASEVILPPLERLAGTRPSDLILLHVTGLVPLYPGEGLPALLMDPATDYLRGLEERFAERRPRVRVLERRGSAVTGILDVVREEQATLIAMATQGRRGLGRLIFGSVTEAVLRESPVPVLAVRVAPDLQAQGPPRTLLVPVDGSLGSRAALPPAIETARRFDARLVLFRVVDPGRESPAEAEPALQRLCGEALAEGVVAHAIVEEARSPASAILAAVADHHADLIVMATQGRTGLARLQAGSVTEEVLRGSPVPLMAVRATAAVASARAGAPGFA